MVLSEFNADGDVTGAYDQAQMLKDFCEMLKVDKKNGYPDLLYIRCVTVDALVRD